MMKLRFVQSSWKLKGPGGTRVILSRTAVYALKAVMYLAETERGTPIRVDEMARELDVPRNYLSKILHALARAGLLGSTRGPKGGFQLLARPEELFLSEIVTHFDEVGSGPGCLLGRTECSDETPCAAHLRWKGVSMAVKGFFQETTVADLSHHGPSVKSAILG